MKIPDKFTFEVQAGEGLWTVTSPEITGLLVADKSMSNAIRAVPEAIADLLFADALEE